MPLGKKFLVPLFLAFLIATPIRPEGGVITLRSKLLSRVFAVVKSESAGKLTDDDCRGVTTEIVLAWDQKGLPPALSLAMIHRESTFTPKATSKCGAVGLMQVMPSTGKNYLRPFSLSKLYDPTTNVRVGTSVLADLHLRHSNGNGYSRAITAYLYGHPQKQTPKYTRDVLALRDHYDKRLLMGDH